MSEWKEYKIKDITSKITSGGTPKSSEAKYYDGNIPWLNTKEINFNRITKTDRCITEEGLNNSSAKWIPKGAVVVAMYGATAAKVAYTQIDLTTNQACCNLIIDDNKADSQFVYYYIQSSYEELLNLACGAAQQNLSVGVIADFPILLPPLDEQKRIVSILSSLDDKIDLLNRENSTLEAMAETLFRQWFIEEAKEDWEEGTISDLIDFNPTRRLAKDTIVPFLEMSNLSTSTYAPVYWYDRAFNSGTKFQNGDTLLARITPCLENGKTAYVDFLTESQIGWGSTEFIVMCSKLGLHPFFSYVMAKYQDFRDYAESCMAGSSGRQRVDVDNLKNYPISIPDKAIINQFNINIESLVLKMQINNKQIRALKAQRDILLSKLMSNPNII